MTSNKEIMSNIASGRQLRAARTLAGLTQSRLSNEAGFNPVLVATGKAVAMVCQPVSGNRWSALSRLSCAMASGIYRSNTGLPVSLDQIGLDGIFP